jgi:AcrR family transcriptional regulator
MSEAGVEERWRDVRRAHLLEAAGRVFARLGYDQASVEDIAFEAGIGKPTLYRYFPGKEALFEAVFEQTLDELEGRLDQALNVDGPFPQRLKRIVAELIPTFRSQVVSMRNLSESGETSKRRVFRQRRGRIESRLVSALESAQARSEIRAIDCAIAARFMIGLVWSGTNSHLSDENEIVDAVVDFALHALGAGGQA